MNPVILKPVEIVLMKLLRSKFMEDISSGAVCELEMTKRIKKNEEALEGMFNQWLIKKGFAQ